MDTGCGVENTTFDVAKDLYTGVQDMKSEHDTACTTTGTASHNSPSSAIPPLLEKSESDEMSSKDATAYVKPTIDDVEYFEEVLTAAHSDDNVVESVAVVIDGINEDDVSMLEAMLLPFCLTKPLTWNSDTRSAVVHLDTLESARSLVEKPPLDYRCRFQDPKLEKSVVKSQNSGTIAQKSREPITPATARTPLPQDDPFYIVMDPSIFTPLLLAYFIFTAFVAAVF